MDAKQILSEPFMVVVSDARIDDLQYLTSRKSAVFRDLSLNAIVKFWKEDEGQIELNPSKGGREYSNLMPKILNESVGYNGLIEFFQMKINESQEIGEAVKGLKTFLQMRGLVIYRNFKTEMWVPKENNEERLEYVTAHSQMFDYLEGVEDEWEVNKYDMTDILEDMRTLSSRGYGHNDLQEYCRNISLVGGTKLMVLDIEAVKRFDFTYPEERYQIPGQMFLKRFIDNLFKDIDGLAYCLSINISEDKYSIISDVLRQIPPNSWYIEEMFNTAFDSKTVKFRTIQRTPIFGENIEDYNYLIDKGILMTYFVPGLVRLFDILIAKYKQTKSI